MGGGEDKRNPVQGQHTLNESTTLSNEQLLDVIEITKATIKLLQVALTGPESRGEFSRINLTTLEEMVMAAIELNDQLQSCYNKIGAAMMVGGVFESEDADRYKEHVGNIDKAVSTLNAMVEAGKGGDDKEAKRLAKFLKEEVADEPFWNLP